MIENYGEMYNTLDDIEKLSKTYEKNCADEAVRHQRKAIWGFRLTTAGALIGTLYTVIHSLASGYFTGASAVYHKYSNIVEDSEKFSEELRNLNT